MESQNTTKELSVEFRNLQLKKIKRPEKQANKGVMEEKFSIVFWTEFVMGEGELKFQLWTLSTPVVVIVHGNQEPQALATVTWDNAFAESMRSPFVVTDKVTWGQVSTKPIVRTKIEQRLSVFVDLRVCWGVSVAGYYFSQTYLSNLFLY